MIRLFEKMFGSHFWKNTLLEVSRWHYDQRAINNRKQRGESEESWQSQWNQKFHQVFDIKVKYYCSLNTCI